MSAPKKAKTIDDAVAAYGGIRPAAAAFRLSLAKNGNAISNWKAKGEVPRGHFLGLYLGLQLRGIEPTPGLFGVSKWSDIPGVGKPSRRGSRR